jgi:hypothetical protein
MIKAHVVSVEPLHAVDAANRTAGETVEAGVGTAVAITTSTATPIDTVIRVAVCRKLPTPSALATAPLRPMCFALSIVVPPSSPGRDGIVAPLRCEGLSGAPLKSRRFRRGTT